MFDHRKDSNYLQLPALARHTVDIVSTVIGGDETTVKSAIAALMNRQQLHILPAEQPAFHHISQ
jgi:hypothetical protein